MWLTNNNIERFLSSIEIFPSWSPFFDKEKKNTLVTNTIFLHILGYNFVCLFSLCWLRAFGSLILIDILKVL